MTTAARNNQTIARPEWLSQDAWPYELKSTEVNGTTVAFTDEGTGPTVVLVSDGLWSFVWGQLIDRLRTSYRVVTLDFPGAGLTPATEAEPGIRADSTLLEDFVTEAELKDITLVAHDLGGPVGLAMATRRPDLVSRLVLVNAFGWRPNTTGLKAMFRIISSKSLTGLNAATGFLYRLTSGSMGVGRHLDADSRRVFRGPYQTKKNRYRFHRLMGSVRSDPEFLLDLETSLETLSDKPVLTIYGERNDPFGFQARFKELFTHAEEMVIERGNHFPMCDDPDGISQRIRAFID